MLFYIEVCYIAHLSLPDSLLKRPACKWFCRSAQPEFQRYASDSSLPAGELGSGPRYMICVTHFCPLRESENTRFACNSRMAVCFACDSRTAVCFLTRTTCKNVRQNLIPRATASGES